MASAAGTLKHFNSSISTTKMCRGKYCHPLISGGMTQPNYPDCNPLAARQTKLIFNWNIFLRSSTISHPLIFWSARLISTAALRHTQRLRKGMKWCWKCILQIQAEKETEKSSLKCGMVKWYKCSRRRNNFCECNVNACRYFPLNLCGEREDWTKITSPVTSSEGRGRRWVQIRGWAFCEEDLQKI